MSFLRRGCIPHPYAGPPAITLNLVSGESLSIPVDRLSCFEEWHVQRWERNVTMLFAFIGTFTVVQTFDEVADLLQGKAVTHVE